MQRTLGTFAAIVSLSGIAALHAHSAQGAPHAPGTAAEEARSAQATTMRDLDRGPPEHVTFRPADVKWMDAHGAFEKGAQMAVLEGDPSKPGVFTVQLKVPDGFVVNPHWHPTVERVTVLKGTFMLGQGTEVDRETASVLPAGTYTAMPPRMIHYAMAEGETIVQLTTVGPWEIHYVDPAHDPRLRQVSRAP